MARYEFRFVVTDVELSEELQQKVSRAVAEAGAMAVAAHTPAGAVTVPYGPHHWWVGLPPPELRLALDKFAAERIQVVTRPGPVSGPG